MFFFVKFQDNDLLRDSNFIQIHNLLYPSRP
jgi:hypothetical protein